MATAVCAVALAAAGQGVATAATPLPRATIAARIHLLGSQNVDPNTGAVRSDRVILSWYGVANFVAAFKGHVVILDSFLRRGYNLREIHTSLDELAALKPEYIFVGHAHFDHALDVGQVAVSSGAPVVGMAAHCSQIKAWSQMEGVDTSKIKCITVMDQNAPPGTTVQMNKLLRNVPITVVRHVHFPYTLGEAAGAGQVSLNAPGGPEFPCPAEPQYEGFPAFPSNEQEVKNLFMNLLGAAEVWLPNSAGGALLYQFHVGELNISWHDTQGALDYYPAVTKALQALPRSDIELGSIASLQRATDCLHDVRLYWQALRTKVFVPIHDDPDDPSEPSASFWKPFLADEDARVPPAQRPCINMIEDPQDYLNPSALTWQTNMPAGCSPAMTVQPLSPQGPPQFQPPPPPASLPTK